MFNTMAVSPVAHKMMALVAAFALLLSAFPTQIFAEHDLDGPYVDQVLESQDSVKICHSSTGKNYSMPPVNVDAIITLPNGHDSHEFDIIPPFHYDIGDGEKAYLGKNWDAAGETIWSDGCVDTAKYDAGYITVVKNVVGNDSADITDFTLLIDGEEVVSGTKNTLAASKGVNKANYIVSETSIPTDYVLESIVCIDTAKNNPQNESGEFELTKDADYLCTVTNKYISPTGGDTVDLKVTKVAEATNYSVGDAVSYTIVVENLGTADATNVTVTDTFETGLTYSTATPSPATTTPLTWNLGTLAAGASTTLTIEGVVANDAFGQSLDNTVVVDSTEVDADETDNTAVATITINDRPLEPCAVTVVSDTTNTVAQKDGAFALALSSVHSAWNPGTVAIPGATWIWGDNPVANPTLVEVQTFEKNFTWNGPVTDIDFLVASDNGHRVFVNGELIGTSPDATTFDSPASYDGFAGEIISGMNTLEIEVTNNAGNANPANNPAGLRYSMTLTGNTSVDCTVVPPPTFTIEGHKYNDLDSDGEKDVDEIGLPDWEFELYYDGVLVATTTTNAEGYYSFEREIGEGSQPPLYEVREVMRSGYEFVGIFLNAGEYFSGSVETCQIPRPTQVSDSVLTDAPLVTDTPQSPVMSCDFFNHEIDTYKIEGYVWHDDNRNQAWDGFDEEEEVLAEQSEVSLAGWQVNITNGTDTFSTTTDEFGYYYFEVEAGTWTITEVVQAGWERTTQESFEVTVPAMPEEMAFFESVLDFLVPTAHAAVVDTFGLFNFGNDTITRRSGGGGVLTSRPRTPDLPEPTPEVAGEAVSNMPEPQVLGEQVSIVPVGAPATGKGGATAVTFAIGQLLAVPRRFNRN